MARRVRVPDLTTSRTLPILTVLLVPLIQLWAGPAWMYTPDGFDQWFYHGYFLHLKHHIQAFNEYYFGTRLAWILPGYVAHSLLSPLAANFALRLYLYWIAILSAYHFIKRSYGVRCAVVCCLLLSGCAEFLSAIGWDYIDGAGIAYGLFCVEEVGAAAFALVEKRRTASLRAGFAGAAFAAAFHTQIFLSVLAPILAVLLLARTGKKGFWLAIPGLGGFVAITAVLGVVNSAVGGIFLFFLPSVRTGSALMKSNTFYVAPAVWASRASWLIVPCAVTIASIALIAWLSVEARKGKAPDSVYIRIADAASLPFLFCIYLGLTIRQVPVLQLPFYSSYLLVFVVVSSAALIGGRLEKWGRREFAVLAGGCVCLALLVGADGAAHLPARLGLWLVGVRGLPMISNFGWIGLLVGAILAAAVIPNRIAGAIVLALVAGAAFVRLGDVKLRDATGGHLSRAIYLDADRASRELGKLSKERSLWFWYALNLAGDQQYTSVSSNYLWMTSLLGKSMPETKDLRVDVLHPGTFVSLMDDREDVVQQGVSVLKQKGIYLLPVARVRSTARPGVFGIGLFRVARLALPSKIYTSSPPASTLTPIAELIDYDLGGILTHTSRVVYGKKAEQNPPLPAWIIPSTDTRDHCATNFLPLSEKGAAAATAVQVDAVDEPAQYDYGRLNLVLQDQDYKVLYWSGTLDGGEDHSVVALPNGTKAVRIAFLANDEGYIRFVKSVHVRALVKK